MDSSTPKPNWALLAGLRFFLALVVAYGHAHITMAQGLPRGFERLNENVAVLLFLIISGYSMRASYEREPEGFFRRRFWRVVPVYWFGIALAFVPFAIWGPSLSYDFGLSHNRPSVLQTGLFAVGLQPLVAPMISVNAPLWSLGVELAFYALVPLLFRLPDKAITLLVVGSACLYLNYNYALNIWWNPWPYLCLFWAFGLGWILKAHQNNLAAKLATVAVPAGIVAIHWSGDMPPLGMTLIVTSMIVWGHKISLTPRIAKIANYLGDLSFPLYATHSVVIVILAFSYIDIPYQAFIFPALLLALATLQAIDKPLRSLGKRSGRKLTLKETALTVPALTETP